MIDDACTRIGENSNLAPNVRCARKLRSYGFRHEACGVRCVHTVTFSRDTSEYFSPRKMAEEEETGATSSVDTTKFEYATAEKQQARAFLRERFLRVVNGLIGEKVSFYPVCACARTLRRFDRESSSSFPSPLSR